MPNVAPRIVEHAWAVWVAALVAVAIIGGIDFASGVELRTFALYYAPISFVAWNRGRTGAFIIAALCAISWATFNVLAGLQYSHPGILIANTLVQGLGFAIVGGLIASLRTALLRERAISRTDPLTSLLNTRAFYEEANRVLAWCRRKGCSSTMAFIDIDNFKAVNDSLGHEAGDDLLRRVATALRASVRPSDVLARLGGDEFAILFPEVGVHEAAVALERLRLVLAETAASESFPVSSSIGGVTFITVPADVQEMLRRADSRMYAAKAMGKNRVHLEVVDDAV